MERTHGSVDDVGQVAVCPNCGHRQVFTALDSRCDACGFLVDPVTTGQGEIVSEEPVGVSDPADVAPAMASGGIGGTPDGTQVTFQVPTAVPGKPMAPIADNPAGSDSFAPEAMDTADAGHAERGGSG
jgi:hypothetical protein